MDRIEQKFSFEDITQNLHAKKHNSDLQNLAQAMMNAEGYIQELTKQINDMNVLITDIKAIAKLIEAGELVEVQYIKELYDRSRMVTL